MRAARRPTHVTAGFYIAAAIAVIATVMTITRAHAMHALLYLIVSLLAVGAVFYVIGAPFVALLEVIVYAGAIMVLFVFAVMMLDFGEAALARERRWLAPGLWIGPSILAGILLVELIVLLGSHGTPPGRRVDAQAVATLLFGPYLLAVELGSMLLLAALVGAYRLGRREPES